MFLTTHVTGLSVTLYVCPIVEEKRTAGQWRAKAPILKTHLPLDVSIASKARVAEVEGRRRWGGQDAALLVARGENIMKRLLVHVAAFNRGFSAR